MGVKKIRSLLDSISIERKREAARNRQRECRARKRATKSTPRKAPQTVCNVCNADLPPATNRLLLKPPQQLPRDHPARGTPTQEEARRADLTYASPNCVAEFGPIEHDYIDAPLAEYPSWSFSWDDPPCTITDTFQRFSGQTPFGTFSRRSCCTRVPDELITAADAMLSLRRRTDYSETTTVSSLSLSNCTSSASFTQGFDTLDSTRLDSHPGVMQALIEYNDTDSD